MIENYPSGYLKSNTSNSIVRETNVDNTSSESTPSDSQIGQKVSYRNNAEKQRLRKELLKQGLDIDKRYDKIVPKGYYYTNTGQLRKSGPKYDAELVETSQGKEIITYGKVPGKVIKDRVEKYNQSNNQPDTQQSKDVTYDSKGFASSKAYELQTNEEKERTAKVSETFISSKDNTNRGDKNELLLSGSANRSNNNVGANDSRSSNINKNDNTQSQKPQGVVTSTVNAFGKPTLYERITRKKEALEQQQARGDKVKFYGIKSTALGLISMPALLISKGGAKTLVTDYASAVTHPLRTVGEIGASAKENPYYFGGQLVGTYGVAKGVGKAASFAKDTYIKTGSEYIPSEKVFSSQVLKEGKTYPTTSSTQDALNRFNTPDAQGNIYVSTASPNKLSGKVAGEGYNARMGLEDSGVYVTPKGEGSPAFLGVTKYGSEFTFNPIKPIKEFFSTPTVTEFKVLGVEKLPRRVVEQPGFEPVRTFFENEGSKSGKAYITKRSEIGQGEIKAQEYLQIKRDKVLGAYDEGKILKESGTTEMEAVVPFKAKFEYTPETTIGKFKGFEQYTTYEGKAIPIRKGRVLGEGDLKNWKPAQGSKVSSVGSAYEESSRAVSTKSFTSPASSIKYASASSRYLGNSFDSMNLSNSNSTYNPGNDSTYFSEPSNPSEPSVVPDSSLPESSVPSSDISISNIPESSIGKSGVSESSVPSIPSSSNSSYTSTTSSSSSKSPVIDGSSYVPSYVPPSGFSFEGNKKKKSKSKLFVKKKGKFELRGEGEDVGLLFKRGKDIIENTASASFKVVSDSGKAILPGILGNRFTKSKKNDGVIVQKREFRISTAGEKFEIPGKAQRNKSLRRLI